MTHSLLDHLHILASRDRRREIGMPERIRAGPFLCLHEEQPANDLV